MSATKGTIICECGEELAFEQPATRIRCGCGALYVATVTQLLSPDEKA